MANFPDYKPVYPAEKTLSPSARNVSFQRGGVYGKEERAIFGINQNPATWNLTFIETPGDAAEIYDFLLKRKIDRKSFTWTPPDSSASSKWKCIEFSKEMFDHKASRVTVVFTQCFEPG